MTKVLLNSIVVLALLFSIGCNNSAKQVEFEWNAYQSAIENSDVSTAIGCLNRIITHEKYNADALDTLSILYLEVGLNNAALKVATRAANVRESETITGVMAKANKNLGKFDQALTHFTKLHGQHPDSLEFLYEMAFCNINLKKGSEAFPFIEKIIKHPESGKQVMQEYYQNASQVVPYKAVALNMLGFLQAQSGQNEAAVKSYQAALSIFPNYYLAQNNLRVLVPQNK
jgi:tetratricopeptide (TPR) repeat protein